MLSGVYLLGRFGINVIISGFPLYPCSLDILYA
jgi:hypothetical protein